MIGSGIAAVVVLANSIAAKVYMSVFWRFKIIIAGDKKSIKDVIESGSYKNAHAAQLNEAEWSPLFLVGLLYLHSKGIDAPFASTLAAVGCALYFWARIVLPFPAQVPGATMRYLSLIMLCSEIYASL